ncbi:MAG: hypothetical protein K0R22_41 [Sporomusa sp.]|jgi:hypothetical protein|nr:hypothetical protein [Sporomusa sp.]
MSNQGKSKPANRVITGKVRLCYAYIFTPKPGDKPTDTPKYSTAVLIPKSDKATLSQIKAAIEAVKNDPKSEKVWGSRFNSEMKSALRDGEVKAEKNPEYAGHYFFNCSNTRKPGIVDRFKNEITDPSEVYSGCYARVSVDFFAFNKGGGKGIGVSLNNVQKWADGEPLSGGSRAEDDFDELEFDDDDILN